MFYTAVRKKERNKQMLYVWHITLSCDMLDLLLSAVWSVRSVSLCHVIFDIILPCDLSDLFHCVMLSVRLVSFFHVICKIYSILSCYLSDLFHYVVLSLRPVSLCHMISKTCFTLSCDLQSLIHCVMWSTGPLFSPLPCDLQHQLLWPSDLSDILQCALCLGWYNERRSKIYK